jgi:hypothetical protein
VYPQVTVNHIYDTICYGTTYTQNGFNRSTSGTESRHVNNANGCDSTITLHLYVRSQITNTINASICNGQTYNQNGFNVSSAGTHAHPNNPLTSVTGCDSIVMLNLSVLNGGDTTTINDAVCYGTTSYTGNGFNINNPVSQIYHRTATNSSGCTYVVKLVLTVYPQVAVNHIYDTICYGTTYNQNGFSRSTSGTESRHVNNANGCDSTITLHLYVRPQLASTINASICQGQTYTQNGFNQSSTGTYYRSVTSPTTGCDSTITLVLSVLNGGDTTNIYDNVCSGAEYHDNGFDITNPAQQTYFRSETNEGGCQYTIALHLIINNVAVPANLTASFANTKVELSWSGNADIYELYRNDEMISNQNNTTFIDDQVTPNQQYCYKVKAIMGDCESSFTQDVCVMTNGLEDIRVSEFKVYPNPAENVIYVEGENFERVVLYDLNGKEVMNIANSGDKMSIDLSRLPQGAYTLQIINNNIVSTKKVIKK